MFREDDFHYAMENTRVLRHPVQKIQTFGTTSFRFQLVSELMDHVDRVRVRGGMIQAEKPSIVSPHSFSKLMLDGFSDEAREYADWLEANGRSLKFLQYGFQFRKTNVTEEIIHGPKAEVLDRLESEANRRDDPLDALIEGVDDAWEVCLLKFTVDLIGQSTGDNVSDWKRRGLL
ncbi:MAG: hypothetical protein WA771_06580 [Chthoniobacterales bacterium]